MLEIKLYPKNKWQGNGSNFSKTNKKETSISKKKKKKKKIDELLKHKNGTTNLIRLMKHA